MLRIFASLLFAVMSGAACAQAFTESFDDITTLAGNGWFQQNNSSPQGSNPVWFQGTAVNAVPDPGPFDAFNGAANSYIAANFNSTSGSTGTISNWLLTPNRTWRNGDVFTFYTRKPIQNPTDFPDRLEVRFSTNGASTNVGANATGTGDFTTLLLSINPSLVTGVYPEVWTEYTTTMSGLPAPTSGRAAFRYFVTNAGPTGANSDYIGIDNVVYTPYTCPAFSMTPGGALAAGTFGQAYSTSLTQTGALGAPNYAITAGGLPPGLAFSAAGAFSGTPTAPGTFNFTVTVNDASGCTGSQSYFISVASTAPGAPQNISAVAGDAQAVVSFSPPLSDGGASIGSYTATCTDGVDAVSASNTASPITVSGLVNGTPYTCTVTATNGVGPGAASAPSGSFTPKGNQTITFDPQPPQTYSPGGSFDIDPPALASSGLAVSYASTTTAVCTVSGSTVSMLAAGNCTLVANQAGDAVWNAAPQVSQLVLIAQADQTLAFPAQTVGTRFFYTGATFAIDPLATSAQPNSGEPIVYSSLDTAVCSLSGTTVTMVAEGTCTLAANQAGDANFNTAAQVMVEVDLVEPTEADLFIEKSSNVERARIGDTVMYVIQVGNHGPADATAVELLDLVPERLDDVVWACTSAAGTACPDPAIGSGDLDALIASLPRDTSLQFELFGTVVPAADPADDYTAFDNTATVALPQDSALTDPAENNTGTATVLVIPDALFADGFEAPLK